MCVSRVAEVASEEGGMMVVRRKGWRCESPMCKSPVNRCELGPSLSSLVGAALLFWIVDTFFVEREIWKGEALDQCVCVGPVVGSHEK